MHTFNKKKRKNNTEPLYGTGIIHYVSVDITETFDDTGRNQYSSAVITEPFNCFGINHKKNLYFHDLWKVGKIYRTVSIFAMRNLSITQETCKK